jgi:hypothetical protein
MLKRQHRKYLVWAIKQDYNLIEQDTFWVSAQPRFQTERLFCFIEVYFLKSLFYRYFYFRKVSILLNKP